jgi:predicted acylesterase/phospholipase RssA
MAKFRILSLDGGGSWALLQVMALQALYSENARGHDILRDFDLVAANSGGSITLGGLIENFTLRDLLTNFFLDQQKRNQIFTPIPLRETLEDAVYLAIGAAPRYQTAAKLTALQDSLTTFGACPMSEVPPRIAQSAGRSPNFVIAAFDYDWKRAVYFRSNLKSAAASAASPPDPSLAEAIHASSTAPVRFFDSAAQFGGRRYWDGGVAGLNNPVLAAVIEALAAGAAPGDIAALSIGTGSVRLPVAGPGVEGDARLIQPPTDDARAPDCQIESGGILGRLGL